MKKALVVLGGAVGFLAVCFTCSTVHNINAAPFVLPPVSLNPVVSVPIVSTASPLQQKFNDLLSTKKITFLHGSAALTNNSLAILDAVAKTLKENPAIRIEVQGHTDNVGPEESNKTISSWRAGEVRAYLIQSGIDGARIKRTGYGSSQPIADNNTEEGRELNRRINILVLGETN